MKADTGRRRHGVFGRIPILLLALSMACSAAGRDGSSEPLIISGSSWITDAPTRIAGEAGYFNVGDGPEIRVELADSGKQSLARLMAGEVDFALMAAAPLAMEMLRLDSENAAPARWPLVLASIGLSNSTHHVIADATQGIVNPGDLHGVSVGLLLGSSAHYGWDRFVDYNGIDPDSVRVVDTPPELLADGLAQGHIDAAVTWTPYSERIMAQLGVDASRFPLDAMDSVSWLLVSRRSVIDGHPDEVQRVLAGYAMAIELLHADPERAASLLGRTRGWSASGHVAWRLALDWPALFNVEDKLRWGAGALGIEPLRLSPARFIERRPLERFRAGAVTLPTWIPEEQVAK